ncbi:hypothetical protein IMSAG025_02096 [Muribaculaceae bacterium]|nr:hypothetical protein IMSAG025_02096 [Muribaculaceae bacterium]
MVKYRLIRYGYDKENEMGGKIVSLIMRQKEFNEKIRHKDNTYPELLFLEFRFFIKRHVLKRID